MAAMIALQTSMNSLSLSSSSFFGLRPPMPSLSSVTIISQRRPSLVVAEYKLWKRKKCKPNSKPVLQKMHVKVGDTVKVISGREKGKIGEITRVFKHNSKVIVKDVNLKTKHVESEVEGEVGPETKIEGPIHSSNVMLYSKEKEVASRVGHKILENGKRVRYLIKTGEIIDSTENWNRLKEEAREERTGVAATK